MRSASSADVLQLERPFRSLSAPAESSSRATYIDAPYSSIIPGRQAKACSFFLLHTILTLFICPLPSPTVRPVLSPFSIDPLSHGFSQEPPLFEARVASTGNDDMVQHLYAHETACVGQPRGEASHRHPTAPDRLKGDCARG